MRYHVVIPMKRLYTVELRMYVHVMLVNLKYVGCDYWPCHTYCHFLHLLPLAAQQNIHNTVYQVPLYSINSVRTLLLTV